MFALYIGIARGVLVNPDIGGVVTVWPVRDLGAKALIGLVDVDVHGCFHRLRTELIADFPE